VLAAALVNRQATVRYVLEQQPEMVWLVGSGWQGSYSLEDTVCAGAIAQSLSDELGVSLEVLAGNDEVVGALALYNHWQNRLLEMFHYASHGQRLLRLDGYDDLKYCSQTDTLDVLPMQKEPGVLISH
jgi:2-phosphosulfolactate phosphatase